MKALLLVALAGCQVTGTFLCDRDEQCRKATGTGTCELAGYCSFTDTTCPSGSRYDTSAGEGFGGACVGGVTVDAAVDAPAFPPFAYRVHVGGPMVVGVDYPGTWAGDPGRATCPNGIVFTTNKAINGTVDDALFMTEVFASGTLTCAIPNLPVGTFRVKLLFAELYYVCMGGPAGPHTFELRLEGALLGTVDPLTEGNGCATETGMPFARQFDVAVGDGTLDLVLGGAASVGSGTVAAIEVVRVQ